MLNVRLQIFYFHCILILIMTVKCTQVVALVYYLVRVMGMSVMQTPNLSRDLSDTRDNS